MQGWVGNRIVSYCDTWLREVSIAWIMHRTVTSTRKKPKQTSEVLAHLLMAGLARRIDTDGGRHVLTVARIGRVKVRCYAR